MVKMAVVGSEEAKWSERQKAAAKEKIREILSAEGAVLVSGACPRGGVDRWAADIAGELGIPKEIYPPEVHGWADRGGRRGYRSRNVQIAEACDVLYDVEPKGRRSGGTWTREHAEKLGKRTYSITIM